MATGDHRIAEFNSGEPTEGEQVELLCEDHNGTYRLPFACKFAAGKWRATSSDAALSDHELEVPVLEWRVWRR